MLFQTLDIFPFTNNLFNCIGSSLRHGYSMKLCLGPVHRGSYDSLLPSVCACTDRLESDYVQAVLQARGHKLPHPTPTCQSERLPDSYDQTSSTLLLGYNNDSLISPLRHFSPSHLPRLAVI